MNLYPYEFEKGAVGGGYKRFSQAEGGAHTILG